MRAKTHIIHFSATYMALRRLAVLCVTLMVATVITIPTGSANEGLSSTSNAAPTRLMGTYDVYWKGLRVFTAQSTMELSDGRYRHSATMRSRGLLRIFLKAEAKAESQGSYTSDSLQPENFISESNWDDDVYARTVAFDDIGKATIMRDIEPEDGDWIRQPVPEELQVGPDPMSLLVAAIQNHWQLPQTQSPTALSFSSFDGVRSMSYEAQCNSEPETLKSTRKSVFAGPAIRCTIKGEATGGYARAKEESEDELQKAGEEAEEAEENARDEGVTMWLASTADQKFMIPVRMELQGRRGKLKVYLAESSLEFN